MWTLKAHELFSSAQSFTSSTCLQLSYRVDIIKKTKRNGKKKKENITIFCSNLKAKMKDVNVDWRLLLFHQLLRNPFWEMQLWNNTGVKWHLSRRVAGICSDASLWYYRVLVSINTILLAQVGLRGTSETCRLNWERNAMGIYRYRGLLGPSQHFSSLRESV